MGPGFYAQTGRECSHASHNYQWRIGVPVHLGTGLNRATPSRTVSDAPAVFDPNGFHPPPHGPSRLGMARDIASELKAPTSAWNEER
jgi:hypothetical protein